MDMNLNSYVKIYNTFDDKTLKETINYLESHKNEWNVNTFYDNIEDNTKTVSGNNECFTFTYYNEPLMQSVWNAYKRYHEDLNFSWYQTWEAFSHTRYNIYTSDNSSQMALHCDHIKSLFGGQHSGIPILTALTLLNDDFEGGELIMFEDTKIDLKAGETIVFPSCFLYPHKVNKVTSGTRYACAHWSW